MFAVILISVTNSSTVSVLFVHYRTFPLYLQWRKLRPYTALCSQPNLPTHIPLPNILIIHLYHNHCNPFASTSQVQQSDHSLDSHTHSKAFISLMDYRSKLVTIACLQCLLAVMLIAHTLFSASDKSLL